MYDRVPPSRRFAIAVSFPGEHRRFVRNVVDRLAEVLGRDRVFYDEWYQRELLGLDGDLKLRRYYREQSELVIPFFSEYYCKDWCQIEWSAIRAMLKHRRTEDAVIPVEMDGTRIEGWEEIDFGIRKGERTGRQIADLILNAYRNRHPQAESSPRSTPATSSHATAGASSVLGVPVGSNFTRNIAGTQLQKHAPRMLFGRDTELAALDAAWAKGTWTEGMSRLNVDRRR